MGVGFSLKAALSKEQCEELKKHEEARDPIRADLEERMGIGVPHPVPFDGASFWLMSLQEVTVDEIRKFCNAIGDPNPLYRDANYAKNTIYGEIIAPPHFLWAICSPFGESVHGPRPAYVTSAFNAGTQTEWFKPIRVGDRFTCTDVPTQVTDCTRDNTAVQFLCRTDRVYRNQRGEVAGIVDQSIMYVLNPREQDLYGQHLDRVEKRFGKYWTEADLREVERLYASETVRGAQPRYWEDVEVGESLPPTYQLFSLMTSVALIAGMNQYAVDWRFAKYARDGWPSWFVTEPVTGIVDLDIMLHLSDEGARIEGVPCFVVQGCYFDLWLGRLVTTWMGDLGFLKKIATQNRKFMPRGSLCVCKGEVTGKRIEDGQHLVDLRIRAEDQDGVLSAPGSATVVLPARNTLFDFPPFGRERASGSAAD